MAQIVFLKADKALISVFAKYTYFTDIFSKEIVTKLLGYSEINKHDIDFIKDQYLSYKLIYSLELIVKLKILKTYIKTYLTHYFIKPSKFYADALIFFIRKPNGSL